MRWLKRRWRPFLVVALAAAIGAGVTFTRGTAFADENPRAPRLTSAQIVDALLFEEGPAAARLSFIDRPLVAWTDELRGIQGGIRSALAADASGFYGASFATAMQSGDPGRVRTALGRLGVSVYSYLEQRYGADRVDDAIRAMGYDMRSSPGEPESMPLFALHIAIAVVAVVVWVVFWAVPSPTVPTDHGLLAERLVNDIAVSLSTG